MLVLQPFRAAMVPIPGADPWYANSQDPALTVMTDFRERPSVTISEMSPIDAALEHMKHAGVRSAFATDSAGRSVVGLITAYDIMSEKPMRFVQAIASTRSDVLVRDLMQRVGNWQVLDIKDIEQASAAAVALTGANARTSLQWQPPSRRSSGSCPHTAQPSAHARTVAGRCAVVVHRVGGIPHSCHAAATRAVLCR